MRTNPAAFKAHIADVKAGGIVIVNGYREAAPAEREQQYTNALRIAAESLGYAVVLVTSASAEMRRVQVTLVTGQVMTVTVDVRTGERRLIEFVLQPVLRYASEGLRER